MTRLFTWPWPRIQLMWRGTLRGATTYSLTFWRRHTFGIYVNHRGDR